MSEQHQKLQALRRKAYEVIEVHYAHLKQVIIDDETLEQTKAAMKKFNTNKKIRAAGFQFNPGLQRWLHIARDRVLVWERNHPKPKPDKPEKKPDKKTAVIEKTISDPLQVVSEVESTIEHVEKPEGEEETPDEAAQPIGEETDTEEKPEAELKPE